MAVPYLTLIANEAIFQLFNKTNLVNCVSRDFENIVASHGESVTILLPETPTVQNAGAAFGSDAASPSTVNLTLDKWRETKAIKMDAKVSSMGDFDLAALYAQPIANALAKDLEVAVATELLKANISIGSTSVAFSGVGPFAEIKQKMDAANTIPDDGRFVALCPVAETGYHTTFGVYTTSGDAVAQSQQAGVLGQKFGMTFVGSPYVSADAVTSPAVPKVIGVAFHRSAVAIASRPMSPSRVALPGTQVTVSYRGVGLTVELWHDPFTSADYIRGQMLYGCKQIVAARSMAITSA